MEIKEITNKEQWESFLLGCQEKTFLQSWNWGEFQKAMAEKVWRLGVFARGEMIAAVQVVRVAAKRGKFLFAAHGPVAREGAVKSEILKTLLEELRKIAKQENCSFIRIAPLWQRDENNAKIFRDLGFTAAPMHTHPELTWQLDLEPPEEEILLKMRKTTRYLIKQGLKNKELVIEKSQNVKDIETFNDLYQKTVIRHHFAPFSLDYLKNEFLSFLPDNQVLIFLAKYRGECLAAAVVIFWQGIAFYHQGASSQKEPKVPASYLLQWQAIREAKARGCRAYNFWGIAEKKNHPWAGLTLFKKGFGGYQKSYLKTQDIALSWQYWLTHFFEKIRKIKRGL